MKYDASQHSVSIFPLDLSDMRTVKPFARETLESLGQDKLDVLLLNAALNKAATGPEVHGSPWCEAYVVNHLCEFRRWVSLCWRRTGSGPRR